MKSKSLVYSILVFFTAVTTVSLTSCKGSGSSGHQSESATQAYEQKSPEFNVDSAYQFIESQCAFGPRTMNSEAHNQCQQWLQQKFEQYGAEVTLQNAQLRLYDGTSVNSTNIIASYNPSAAIRIMICSHWDSRHWADNDPDESLHHTPLLGANDGASGVAVMLELARLMQQTPVNYGVDLICFDAEDQGTPQWAEQSPDEDHSDTWCLGSAYWAKNVHKPGYRARFAILLDMVGGANCVFRKEYFSLQYAPQVLDRVWATARQLNYGNYFVNEQGGGITDDHLQVMATGIQCIDIIGSDKDGRSFCTTWHTHADDPQHIDKSTLKAVGQTVAEVIYTEEIK